MKKIDHYVLPINTNTLYEEEAISSIGLTRDVAAKINELVDAYNEFSGIDLGWKQEQEGIIRKAVLYIKDNLYNTMIDILKSADFYDIMNEDTQTLIIRRSEDLQKQIKALASGSPIPAYSTNEMTDTSRIYVNLGDGKWYYHDGTKWTAVATYQATQIEDKEVTSDKRTAVGDYGYLFSEKGEIKVDIDNLKVLFSGSHMLIYRDHIITVETDKELEIPSVEPYMLYFDTNERDFRWHRPSNDLYKANEDCVYLGYIAVSDGGYTQINAPRYTVAKNGKKTTYKNGSQVKSSRNADLLSGKVEIDTNNKQVVFTSAVYSLGVSYISLSTTVSYEETSAARIKYVVYDTKDQVARIYENRNAENEDEILLFAFYNGKVYHSYVNRHLYTINGVVEGNSTDKLYKKKALFSGDSITRGAGSSKPFTSYLSEMTSLTADNIGEDGACMTVGGNKNVEDIDTKLTSMTAEDLSGYDIIGVMGGTNDFWNNVDIGTLGDVAHSATFYGALKSIVLKLKENAPGKFIFLMTPIIGYRSEERVAAGFAEFPYPTNEEGKTLNDYCEAIRQIGAMYSVPVLDMNKVSGLCSLIPTEDARLYYDGVHPNSAGYEQMAKVIANFLETNYR